MFFFHLTFITDQFNGLYSKTKTVFKQTLDFCHLHEKLRLYNGSNSIKQFNCANIFETFVIISFISQSFVLLYYLPGMSPRKNNL